MSARSSAPGAAFLLGEHAVVYDQPALLLAVDRRATVSVERTSEDSFPSPYVREAVESVREHAGEKPSLKVEVKSEIPVGAGLGSSAAVTVATVHAASRELGVSVDVDTVAHEAHRVERAVQGAASPADTYTSATGGYTLVGGDGKESIGAPDARFVVGWDGDSAPTGEMVDRVATLVDDNPVAADVIESIGDLSRQGVERARAGQFDALADFMDMNQGLLAALDVSSSSLSRAVWAARDAGGSAKLTGAGGAGCIVAYPANDEVRDAVADETEESYVVSPAEGVRPE